MKSFLLDLVEYHHHYNKLFIEHCKRHREVISERTLELLNHSIAAQVIWNKRIIGDSEYDPSLWTNRDIQKMCQWEIEHTQITTQIIQEMDMEQIISYTNSKDEQFSSSVGDIIFHALNHYTYHRGQITLEFRKAGLDAIPSDYIFYKR